MYLLPTLSNTQIDIFTEVCWSWAYRLMKYPELMITKWFKEGVLESRFALSVSCPCNWTPEICRLLFLKVRTPLASQLHVSLARPRRSIVIRTIIQAISGWWWTFAAKTLHLHRYVYATTGDSFILHGTWSICPTAGHSPGPTPNRWVVGVDQKSGHPSARCRCVYNCEEDVLYYNRRA